MEKYVRTIERAKTLSNLFDKNNMPIKVSTERDIFNALSVEYLPPKLR